MLWALSDFKRKPLGKTREGSIWDLFYQFHCHTLGPGHLRFFGDRLGVGAYPLGEADPLMGDRKSSKADNTHQCKGLGRI